MALATKYRIEGTSDIYGKVTVNIQLDGYVGAIIPLEGVGRNWIELKIGDNSNDISNPILAGKLTFSFYVLEDFETTEIGRSQANTYYVEVLDDSNDQIWAGWALPEEYKEAYHNTPYVATVVASDGLDELKNANFPLQDGKADLFTHLQICLIQTFVNNDIFESINIYSNGMATTSADSPLKQAEVTYNSFRSISETPKAYEVLSAILVPFFARIYQYRGWRIENILSKRSSYIVRQYDITGAYIGQSTFDPLVKFDTDYNDFRAFIQKSGQLSIRPALNNAEVYFNTVEPVEPTTSQGFQKADDWVSTTELDKWTAVGSNIAIEQVTSSFNGNEFAVKIPGRKTTLEQTDYLESDPIAIASADYETINIEFAHYANYPAIVLLGTKPILYFEVVFTETSTGDVYNWTGSEWVLIPLGQARRRLRIDFNDRMKWRLYSASIDRVPSTGNIKFRFYKLIKSGSEGVTELRLTAWKTNLITQQATNAALLLEGATTNVFTQYKGPSFPHIISDGTVLNAAGVMDVSNTLTATWARRGVTESLNIRRLFLLQWLTFNSKPTEILSGTIHQKGEVITPMSVIKDKDGVSAVRYVMTSYSFSLGSGIGSGSYRELVTVDANINAFQEFLDSIRLGDFFPQTINYNIFIGGAPGLSPGANPGQIDLNFSLNGDVRGGLNQAELTPASIQNKARLDTTGLTGTDIVIGAVKDDPSQENMTNLRLSDTYPILDTNFVPYTGAKANVDLGEKGLSSGFIKLDTTPTSTPTDQGTMFWDEDDNTVDIVLNGYIMKVGEDQFYPVKNQTGSNIAKGVAVRFAGTVGSSGRLLIAPFLADGTFPSTRFMGVTAEDIDNGEDGKVLWFGRLRGIDTSAFAEGDILYASTTVAGGFQTTVPVAPNNIVEIAAVVTDAVNGTIFIRPQILQGTISIGSPANGLSLAGTVLSLGLASSGVTGALSGTDWNTFNGKIGGTIASGQVAFGTGVNTVGGGNAFFWDNTNGRLRINLTSAVVTPLTVGHSFGRLEFGGLTTNISYIEVLNLTRTESNNFRLYSNDFSIFTRNLVGTYSNRIHVLGNGGNVGISTDSPTNTLDVNGTARIRTISNLGSTATRFLVASATGVVSERTGAQLLTDAGGIAGTIASGQVAFGTGVNTVGGDSGLTWDNTTKNLTVLSNSLGTSTNYPSIHIRDSFNGTYSGGGAIMAELGFWGNDISGLGSRLRGSIRLLNASGTSGNLNDIVHYYSDGVTSGLLEGFRLTYQGRIGVLTSLPTNTLDVNGTARIRTISNLGSTATRFLVASATGVVSERTGAELAADIGATALSGLTTNRIIKATSATSIGNTGITEESAVSYLFGSRTPSASATPLSVSFGATVGTNTAGGSGNLKWKLYDDGFSNQYGIGMSSGLMEFVVPSGAGMSFFANSVRAININSSASVTIGTANNVNNLSVVGLASISCANNLRALSLGLGFATGTRGSQANVKLAVYNNGSSDLYGFGVSSAWFQIISPSGSNIGFYPSGVEVMTLTTSGNMTLRDTTNIILGTTTGTKIGTATNQRLAFYNSTPIVQPSGDILTALSNLGLVASPTITPVDQFTAKTTASADQTLPSGTLTILDYDTTVINNNTSIYTVGTTGRITVNSTGIYTITAGVVVEADAITALESAFLGIFRNGDLVSISSINTTIAAGAQSGLSTSTILSLTSGDIIDCRALVNSVGGVANGLARRLGTLLGANATQVNSLSITKSSQ